MLIRNNGKPLGLLQHRRKVSCAKPKYIPA